MDKGGGGEQQPVFFQIFEHHGVRFLHKYAGKGGLCGHIAFGVHQLGKGKIIFAADPGVVLTEGGGDVYHAGTVGEGDIIVAHHIVSFFALLGVDLYSTIKERLIFFVFQILTGHLLQDGVIAFSQYGIGQRLSQIVGEFTALYLDIGIVGVDAQRHVGGQGPGGGGPGQDIGVLPFHLKLGDGGALLDLLISLGNLMAGKRGSAAGAIGHNLKAFVQQPFLPDLLERPPFRLDEIVVIGDIGFIHIRPESNDTGEILPHTLVFPDALFTLLDKGFQTVGFDLFLSVQSQLLLDLQLYRQAMGIPTGFPGNHIAFHGAVAGDHILDDAGEHMTNMRFAVGRGRSVIEGIGGAFLAVFHTLFKDMVLFPEIQYVFFPLDKVQFRRYFFVHAFISSFFIMGHRTILGRSAGVFSCTVCRTSLKTKMSSS